MTDGKKIGLTCAIGGAIGTVVALIVAAPFWWLGLLAGFSGGYVSYEFRAVLRAIPEAFRMAVGGIGVIGDWIVAFIRRLFKLLFTNPILHFAILDVGIVGLMFILLPSKVYWFSATGIVIATGLLSLMIFLPIQMGAVENAELSDLTYREVARGYVLCALVALVFWVTLLTLPVWLPIAVIYFLYKLFRLVHSDKRLLCGVDAAIGTGLAYVTLARPACIACGEAAAGRPEMTLAQYALVIAAGALIGAAFGVLNYEVVSKRILHLNGAKVRSA